MQLSTPCPPRSSVSPKQMSLDRQHWQLYSPLARGWRGWGGREGACSPGGGKGCLRGLLTGEGGEELGSEGDGVVGLL